jgi:hypothetical protein
MGFATTPSLQLQCTFVSPFYISKLLSHSSRIATTFMSSASNKSLDSTSVGL